MAPQQGQHDGDRTKKRPADASLASASSKKPKTGNDPGQGGSRPSVGPQRPGPAKKHNSLQNAQVPPFETKGSERESRRPGDIRTIRAIAAQPSDAALKDGELDVQAFLEARGFEIKALDESLRRTRVSKSSRAFQKVPFVMRRRAAAHNHKRVPRRLQRRAKREMEQDNTPTVNSKTRKPKTTRSRLRAETALRLGKLAERKRRQKLAKKGRDGKLSELAIQTRLARPKIKTDQLNQPVVTARKFRKRQLAKTWLPTHLWHAKRAKMTAPTDPLWRFAVPLTPNQKCYRPTHRTLWEKGAMAWDMSYTSTISLRGVERSVIQVLKAVGLVAESLWTVAGDWWRAGGMHWNGTLTRRQRDSTKMIGPATIVWNPQVRGEQNAKDQGMVERRVFVRLHPSMFLETFNELLRLARGLTPRPHVEDLRYEIGSIEVTGPDATEALLGVLKPYHQKPDEKAAHGTKWESLAGISPSELPAGSLLAFSAQDPRLQYPPRRIGVPNAANRTPQTVRTWREDTPTEPFALFNRDSRFRASRLPSQKSLNRRRSRLSPGALLAPTQLDPEIPVILLASRRLGAPGKWTVLLPWKCVLPVWYTLLHYPLSSGGNPLFGGLHEIQQCAFEQGLPWFPGDYPGTNAGVNWELEQRQLRKKAWDRMPKGKRTNYETLDLGAGRKGELGPGWNCDFETLLCLGEDTAGDKHVDAVMTGQDDNAAGAAEDIPKQKFLSSLHPLDQLIQISKAVFNAQVPAKDSALSSTALVTVKIRIQGRGVPGPCARVYRLPAVKTIGASILAEVPATEPPLAKSTGLPSDLGKQWLATLPQNGKQRCTEQVVKHNSSKSLDLETRKRSLARELIAPLKLEDQTLNGHPLCPGAEDLIGFVTTGSFNLKNGQAEAIASLSAEKAIEETRRFKNKDDRSARLCIVRNAGQNIGWLGRWEII